jgi:DNA segregation ATPase FtsK/SpoIIIE-like protein
MKTKPKKYEGEDLRKLAMLIEQTLASFGITARVADVNILESDVEFRLEVALGTNIKKIEKIDTTIAMAVASPTGKVKIEAPIPGLALVGIKIPYGKNTTLKKDLGEGCYKVIEKPAEIKTEYIDRTWWHNITFILGNIADLLREGFEIVAKWFWKLS